MADPHPLSGHPGPGARPAEINKPLEGALWMILSCALLSILAGLGREISFVGVDPIQIVFCRLLFAWLCMLPWLLHRARRGPIRTTQFKLYAVRAVISIGAMSTWFYAVSIMPIGDVTALSFLAPLFSTLGAALILKETVGPRRWSATAIGFLGALIIIRPGITEMGFGSWLALSSALFMGCSVLIVKTLTRGDDPWTVVFFSHLIMIPLALVPTLFVWTWPAPAVWGLLLATGPVAVVGHICLTKAFSLTDVSIISAVDFFRLPFAVLVGFVAFGEVIDIWTWVGAAVVFAAALYVVRREHALANAR